MESARSGVRLTGDSEKGYSIAWGSTKSVGSDVRVIAATNKTLEEEVRTGKFRKHLYFRLNVLTIKLPPMRQRVDDIRDLAETFLLRPYCQRHRPKPPKTLSEEALRLLKTYHWPGNVGELENLIERAVALASGSKPEPSDFPSHIDKDVVLPGSIVRGERICAESAFLPSPKSNGMQFLML
jgi:DNA-binding NtrC family response regulator